MSLLKCLRTEVNEKPLTISLPDKKTIILRGQNNIQVLYIIESLLSNDFTGYYFDLDKIYGFNYKPVTGLSQLDFNDGSIYGKDKMIKKVGMVPNIHCIRGLGDCNKFRSFCLSDNLKYNQLYTDMKKYSGVVADNIWVRLISIVNNIVEEDIVFFDGDKITFKFLENYKISVEGQKLIYLLVAECFLTPDGYSRVLLLPNISCLDNKTQLKLLESIDNIKGHTLTLSTAGIEPDDLSENSVVSFLNV